MTVVLVSNRDDRNWKSFHYMFDYLPICPHLYVLANNHYTHRLALKVWDHRILIPVFVSFTQSHPFTWIWSCLANQPFIELSIHFETKTDSHYNIHNKQSLHPSQQLDPTALTRHCRHLITTTQTALSPITHQPQQATSQRVGYNTNHNTNHNNNNNNNNCTATPSAIDTKPG